MPRLLVLALLLTTASARADPQLTFEAGLGRGGVTQIYDNPMDQPVTWSWDNVGAAPLSLGAGAFVTPDLALTARLVTGGYSLGEQGASGSATFVGASAQYWLAHVFWVGGGAGIVSSSAYRGDDRYHGGIAPALDLRVGAAVLRTDTIALQLSLEYTPGLYTKRFAGDRTSILGLLGLSIGVQFL